MICPSSAPAPATVVFDRATSAWGDEDSHVPWNMAMGSGAPCPDIGVAGTGVLTGGAVGGATVGEGLGCAVGDGVGGGCVGVGGGAVGDGVGDAVCAKLDAPPKDSIATIASMTIAIDLDVRIVPYSLCSHESQHSTPLTESG